MSETGRDDKEINLTVDRKASQHSFRTNKKNETQNSMKDSYKETIHKLEDNEKLLAEQVYTYIKIS